MLRLLYSICAFLFLTQAYSQANFELYTNGEDPSENYAPLFNLGSAGYYYNTGYTGLADFNGDGMPDFIQDGASSNPMIWLNDGTGNLAQPMEVEGPSGSSLAVAKYIADFDQDGDEDIFYAQGYFLYNDGSGNFTVVQDLAIVPKGHCQIDVKDLDGEGGKEIIVSSTLGFHPSVDVYRRKSDGTYESTLNIDLDGVLGGGFHCADVDNDNDNDIIVYGYVYEADTIKFNLYRNDGSGSFVRDTPAIFEGFYDGAIQSADLNEDGLLDLVVSGSFGLAGTTDNLTRIFLGDAEEEFVEVQNPGIISTVNGGIELSDFNGDGQIDILIGGSATFGGYPQTKLYLQSDSQFIEDSVNAFPSMYHPTFQRLDYDGDGFVDVFMEGLAVNGTSFAFSRIYMNDGEGVFSQVVSEKHIARNLIGQMVDLDGDGRSELHFSGLTDEMKFEKLSYSVTESGELIESENQLPLYSLSAARFFDIDADGDLDILQKSSVADADEYGTNNSIFFLNQGDGTFDPGVEVDENDFIGTTSFVDINNDNYLDIFYKSGRLYINDGGNNFEQVDSPFYGYNTDYFPSDVDNDGDMDVISVAGLWENTVVFYINDGEGNFEINQEMTFFFGSNDTYDVISTHYLKTADLDGDGDLDLLVKMNSSGLRVFINEEGGFVQAQHFGLDDLRVHALIDLDNDGDLDLFMSRSGSASIYTRYNDGLGNFLEQGSDQFDELKIWSVSFSDLEGDGDIDILYTGTDSRRRITSRLYINSTNVLSTSNEGSSAPIFNLYPNPTNGSFQINSTDFIQSVAIVDISGREVFRSNTQVRSKQYQKSLTLSNGIYIVQVTYDDSRIASKNLVVAGR